MKLLRSDRPDRATRRATTIAHEQEGGVPVTWINPIHRRSGVVVYLHGGAYIVGPTAQEWRWAAAVAKSAGIALAVVHYRMPPEHPFPAALDDASAAVRSLLQAGALADSRWVLAGTSAGGGLAIACLRRLLDESVAAPAGLLLVSPWVDLAMESPEAAEADTRDPILSRSWLLWAARLYAAGESLCAPRLSPLGGRFSGFPPTRIDVGTRDLFLPDNRRLRDRLRAASIAVDYVELDGGVHAYPQMPQRREAEIAVAQQATWAAARLRP